MSEKNEILATREAQFFNYMKVSLKDSTARGYLSNLREKSFCAMINKLFGTDSIYEIDDLNVLKKIYDESKKLPINKAWNNAISASIGKYIEFLKKSDSNYSEGNSTISSNFAEFSFIQKIFFGAPGTGKSHKIDYNLFKDKDGNPIEKGIKEIPEDRKFRTTFHPDYDYAQFVGAYKPRKKDDDQDKITYSFVPQVFAKSYAAAWKQYFAAGNASTAENQVYLVIEEINRGNCAQIFGDIFQLLDRDADGSSQYSIDADCDFAEWLEKEFKTANVWDTYVGAVGDGKLKLPPNLNILATMNTSDQSLFPMDSAFKRRFDWEYVPISFTDEKGNKKEAAKYEIDVPDANGKNYLWKNFVETVNDKILDLTESEDKQLGEFFIKSDSGNVISKERFLGKVMFYLWNEVCKDEHKNGSFFRAKINDKEDFFTFQDLYKKKDLLKLFMDELLKKE